MRNPSEAVGVRRRFVLSAPVHGGAAGGPLRLSASPRASAADKVEVLERCYGVHSHTLYNAPRSGNLDVLFVIDNFAGHDRQQQALVAEHPRSCAALTSRTPTTTSASTTDVGSYVAPDQAFVTRFRRSSPPASPSQGTMARSSQACSLRQACRRGRAACTPPARTRASSPSTAGLHREARRHDQRQAGAPERPGHRPAQGFGCLGMLGDSGCASGHAGGRRRALSADDSLSANRGFLRSDSVLSVVFLTDEDDCSVPAMRRSQNDPRSGTAGPPTRGRCCLLQPGIPLMANSILC